MEQIITFNGFTLDRFQVEAIESIEKNHSVVVSAATGTGKTLIADYVIDKYLKQGKKIVYTAPIKALSNQKYHDFKRLYGQENTGILTGDVTINHDAPLLVMTTEIYRNMLLSKDPFTEDIAYVVFDEIHFLGDIERGTVWEESIIFSHEKTRFLCLSATIPNAKQLANWINYIKKHEVDVVTEKKRAVPLKHQFYDSERGFSTLKEIKEYKNQEKYANYNKSFKHRKKYVQELRNQRKLNHIDLLADLEKEKKLPCIYFCFSRLLTEQKADILKNKKNYLNAEESALAGSIIRKKFEGADKSINGLKTTHLLRQCLSKGIAFHHAGILAVLKETVEELFSKGLVKVLFATETFAVGINMPAKTVCFDSLEKFDGISFRYLNSKEYFQLAGRAGRRGIDTQGYAISMIQRDTMDIERVQRITDDDKEPLKSAFKLSYNTVLNLIHSHSEQEQQIILQSSFYSYQKEGKQSYSKIIASFEKKKTTLLKLGYIEKEQGTNHLHLTEKGLFARLIYTEELLVTEMFCSESSQGLTEQEILLLTGSVCFEERKNIKMRSKQTKIADKVYKRFKDSKQIMSFLKNQKTSQLEQILMSWLNGAEFIELMDYTTMLEGDIVRFIRQILDLLQQIHRATMKEELKQQIQTIKKKIDRDVISIRF